MPQILYLQPGNPNLTANGVATLMQQLNHMQVDVNPLSLDFGLSSIPVDASMLAELAKGMEAGQQEALPETLMYPSWVSIVFNDGPTATTHERDCSHANEDFNNLDRGRILMMPSRELAQGVLECLSTWGRPSIDACIVLDGYTLLTLCSDRSRNTADFPEEAADQGME